MDSDLILGTARLGFPWQTLDPFLFCVHHDDAYPAGNTAMGPAASLAGRSLGNDFVVKDGWRMYHGEVVPGFPRHPHRGFETVTLARRGFIDHSDSLGATARFGHGDVQWMTAGRGVVHAEMFPLVRRDAGNPTELFQIWLNLPKADKMVDPYFTMLWGHTIPRQTFRDRAGRATEVVTVANAQGGPEQPAPPPNSWASRPESAVEIRTIKMEPGAQWTLPAGPEGVHRVLYFFQGSALAVGDHKVPAKVAIQLHADQAAPLEAGPDPCELLLLQGRPIGEPVAHHGPFVMNTRDELRQAFADYQRTGFGGWPWDRPDPVHPRDRGRFAVHADGREEVPPDALRAG
ncbi:MAG: pirin family protein [Alphaproteobacteria bacterium]|nr:pirin family protein [Alphaproteobacteria bacterium]